MPISALPQETVRLLGSPLVYSTPAAVVKELVDNAIDAQATSVEVLISANTVDSIEVRDNGHGIHPDDFSTLGHRGCTSKLRTFDEIQTVGGVTLGFRGDALASATTVGTLSIVTRTAGEPTASRLLFSEKGGVGKVERVSGPFGTAVKVTQIFDRLPVRKQCALKEAVKTIPKIKDLLHSYAFARPHIKLAFRVLNQPKTSWSYAPGPHPNIRQAALQVFGAELVSQCVDKTNAPSESQTDTPGNEQRGIFKTPGKYIYTIEALLPIKTADATKISKGAWFSIDSRPVSSAQGTIKTLYTTFKDRLKREHLSSGCATILKSPFLAVNIKCPPKSYDPNVEPSKEEVLFANSPRLVEDFRLLLDEVYSTIPQASSVGGHENTRLASQPSHQVSMVSGQQDEGSHLLSPEQTPCANPPSSLRPDPEADVSDDSWIQGLFPNTAPNGPQQGTASPRMTIEDIKKLEQATQASGHSHYKSPPSSGGPELRPRNGINTVSNLLGDDEAPWMDKGWQADLSLRDSDEQDASVPRRKPQSRNPQVDHAPEDAPMRPAEGVNPWVLARFNADRNQHKSLPAQRGQQTQLTPNDLPARVVNTNIDHGRALPMRVIQQTRLTQDGPPAATLNAINGQGGTIPMQTFQQIHLPQNGLPAAVLPDAHPQHSFLDPRAAVSSEQEIFGQQFRSPLAEPRTHATGVPGGAFRPPMSSGGRDPPQGTQRRPGRRRGPSGFTPPFAHGERVPRLAGGGRARQQSHREVPEENWFQDIPSSSARRNKRHQRGRPGAGNGVDVDRDGQLRLSNDELRGQMRLFNDPSGQIRLSREEADANPGFANIRQRLALAEARRLREQAAVAADSSAQAVAAGMTIPSVGAPEPALQVQPAIPQGSPTLKTGLAPGDPRAFLMRKECSLPARTPRKLRRVKSCMLPLETTPAGAETFNLMQTVEVDVQKLCQSLEAQDNHLLPDVSVHNTRIRCISPDGLRVVRQRVLELLTKMGYTGQEGDCQIEFQSLQSANGEGRQIEAGL